MINAINRATLFALYNLSVLVGIVLLPVAVLARRSGVMLPIHRVIRRLGEAYDEAAERADP